MPNPNEDLVREIIALRRLLDDLRQPEQGYAPHFLTTPYTNAGFDGDAFSDVGSNTKIENTSWSTTIPANAVALLIQAACRDSDSAGTNGLYLYLYGAAAATIPALAIELSGKPNDTSENETGIVPCTSGDIWYRVNASGAGTLDVWLRVFGYWV